MVTRLLGLVILSHFGTRGSGRFKVVGLHEGVHEVVSFVRARGVDRGECLLNVAGQVCLAVRRGAYCGAAWALAFV